MADFFKDIAALKERVGGAVHNNFELKSLAPAIKDAARKHLMPWISQALYDAAKVNYTDSANDPNLDNLTPYIQEALGRLALLEYSRFGTVGMSDMGLTRQESDSQRTAYKYQENEYRDYQQEHGYEAIEDMLLFLEANEADYPLWQASAAYKRNKQLFINNAATFRDVYSKYISRYTFEIMRPAIEDVETMAIEPILGSALFAELKDAILTKSLTADEQILLTYIQRPVAHFAVREAMARHWVKILGQSIVQTEKLGDQSLEKESPVIQSTLVLSLSEQELWGDRYISRLHSFLEANAETYPLYEPDIEEQAEEVAPEEERCGDLTKSKSDSKDPIISL